MARSKKGRSRAAEGEGKMPAKERGDELFKKGAFREAVAAYAEALQECGGDGEKAARVRSNRSAALHAMRRFKNALDEADMVIKALPTWAKGYARRGKALEGLVLYDEAMAAHTRAFELDSGEVFRRALTDCKYNVMIEWLLHGGAHFPHLYLRYYEDDYRGVHTRANIPPEDDIMRIPRQFIMTMEKAKTSAIGTRILQSGVALTSQHTFIACYLLQERQKEASFWDPYLRCLPISYSNMPINFSDDEKEYLKGSFALNKMEVRSTSLKQEYDKLCAAVPEAASLGSLEDFIWARHVVITRIFGMVIEPGVKTNGLVPMADMLNHKRPRETRWTYKQDHDAFTITSLRALHLGDQVYDSYGKKCNHRFFVNYGFALEDNEDNETVLRFSLGFLDEDPNIDTKQRLLGNQSLTFQVPAETEEKTKGMFSVVRLLCASTEDLSRIIDSATADTIPPLSVPNEVATLQCIREAAERCLARFECTLEEDNRLLQDTTLSSNIRNCILMRRGEKKVCRYFMYLADTAIPLFAKSADFVRDTIRKHRKHGRKMQYLIEPYLVRVVLPLVE